MCLYKNFDWNNITPDFNTRENLLNKLCKEYPDINKKTLTKSLCGREIEILEIGLQDNPIIFVGAFHGMEWLTSTVLIKLAAKLADCLRTSNSISNINVKDFIKKRGVVIIPCLNPDGVEISLNGYKSANEYSKLVYKLSNGNTEKWQANARGVDLNHNFDAGWYELHKLENQKGIISASPTRYGGEAPESESETKALADLCREKSFKQAIALHSQGEEIYWKYGNFIPERSELIARVMAESSGYKLAEPEQLATGGGFKDWFITYFKRPAFTIEIGLGKNPLPKTDFDNIYNKIEEMLILSIIL